jgi:DNA-binding response OmpR family regulator
MRILLIDDDRDFVEATRTVLESVPYAVDVAYNGAAGLAHARAARPDLIILDIIMPGEDGLDIYEKMQAEPGLADVPVILLTSLSSGLGVTPSTPAKPVKYLEKPVRPAELLKRVRELVE